MWIMSNLEYRKELELDPARGGCKKRDCRRKTIPHFCEIKNKETKGIGVSISALKHCSEFHVR